MSKPEMNLDVDAPDKVAGVLTAAATAYQASAVELSPAWQDRQIPMIWAADTTYDGPDGSCGICIMDDLGLVRLRHGTLLTQFFRLVDGAGHGSR